MKTALRFTALLVATLGGFLVSSLPAAPTASPAAGQSVNQVTRNGEIIVKLGTAESTVWNRLGSPVHKLTENVWVYSHFQANPPRLANDDCDRLVITFRDDKVVDIKLVNPGAYQVLIAQAKRDPSALASVFVPDAKAGTIETAANTR